MFGYFLSLYTVHLFSNRGGGGYSHKAGTFGHSRQKEQVYHPPEAMTAFLSSVRDSVPVSETSFWEKMSCVKK